MRRAQDVAEALGVEPEAALLGEGLVAERIFYSALARELGVRYYDGFPAIERNTQFELAVAAGYARLEPNAEGLHAVVAPRGAALRLLVDAVAKGRGQLPIAIASRQRLSACLRAQFGKQMADKAANQLSQDDAALSARGGAGPIQLMTLMGALAVLALGIAFAPALVRLVVSLMFWSVFSCAVWLRSMAIAARAGKVEFKALSDAELPVYTVIAPLYREAAVAAQLIEALDNLDYPRAKLDIKLMLERDDDETVAALTTLQLPARFDVVLAPPGGPKTKPRALNMALAAARGSLLVVYDAEDRPDPRQLRQAAAQFAADPDVECLQARLAIDNGGDSWLAEQFAVEYAVLFDLFNAGLAALRMPIALGGTSNHFRIEALKQVGGWDPWNVTEDADLGLRLARFGMRVATLDSDTVEEAPHEFGNWFKQRMRWQKGWMQTLIVHTRQPGRIYRELGAWATLSAFALIGGGLSGSLFGALFMIETLARLAGWALVPGYTEIWIGDIVTVALMLWGAQSLVVPAALAMRRRRMKGLARVLLTMPLYLVLLSLTSWAAWAELVIKPHHWRKTAHGRQKSRLAAAGQGEGSELTGDLKAAARVRGR